MAVCVFSEKGFDGFLHICVFTLPESWLSQAPHSELSSNTSWTVELCNLHQWCEREDRFHCYKPDASFFCFTMFNFRFNCAGSNLQFLLLQLCKLMFYNFAVNVHP
ncbi:hypothetical protein NC652_003373 [Populus alba x Populus x berolinensis]|nr:hypothetical protein NC652_003373 [Populus alba x Populus x berolinensis]